MDNLPYKVVAHLSRVVKRNKDNQHMEQTYISREYRKHILSYDDSSKLCHVITYFTELNQYFEQEDITFPLSPSSRAIEWKNKNPIE